MRITQFTLLQALQLAPGISPKQLAELLGIDSTTLIRTLAPNMGKDCCNPRPEPTAVSCGFA
jgi:hypothetical protein